jgi:hypothetical protein
MMHSLEIVDELRNLGFSVRTEGKGTTKTYPASRADIQTPLYVKRSHSISEKTQARSLKPLVLHSKYLPHFPALEELVGGIYPSSNYFHSTSLKGFDLRENRGNKNKLIEYGYGLDVRDKTALRELVDWLAGKLVTTSPVCTAEEDIANAANELSRLGETERETIINARRGQGKFRDDLLDHWGICAVSDVALPAFLRASHIKPWRDCSNSERLDPFNGFPLNTTLDAAFDQGYISFADDGRILISEALQGHTESVGIDSSMSLKKVDERHLEYLAWHRRSHGFSRT